MTQNVNVGDHFHRDGYVWEVIEVDGDTVRMRRAGKIIECKQQIEDLYAYKLTDDEMQWIKSWKSGHA